MPHLKLVPLPLGKIRVLFLLLLVSIEIMNRLLGRIEGHRIKAKLVTIILKLLPRKQVLIQPMWLKKLLVAHKLKKLLKID